MFVLQLRDASSPTTATAKIEHVQQAERSRSTLRHSELNTNDEWIERQRQYWDKIANRYDHTYSDAWSLYENTIVERTLSRLLPRDARVVEFGCGTGLGYGLMTRTRANLNYTGIDVSAAMLSIFRSRRAENVTLINASLESIAPAQFTDVDLVVAIFTSASYIDMELDALLSLLCKWLRPGGCIYISFLNRTFLAHMPRWGLRSRIEYATRGIHLGTVPARRYTKLELLRACRTLNLRGRVHSLGPFAGLVERPVLEQLNSALRRTTLLTHTIELVATKAI